MFKYPYCLAMPLLQQDTDLLTSSSSEPDDNEDLTDEQQDESPESANLEDDWTNSESGASESPAEVHHKNCENSLQIYNVC